MSQFGHIPSELMISFPSEFTIQSMLQSNFNYITSSSHMMQNQTDHMNAFMNSITSHFNYRVENENKTGSNHSDTPFHMHGYIFKSLYSQRYNCPFIKLSI